MTPSLAVAFVALLVACVALLVAFRTRGGGRP